MSFISIPTELWGDVFGSLSDGDAFSLICAFRLNGASSPEKTARLERMLKTAVRRRFGPALCSLLTAEDLRDTEALTDALDDIRPFHLLEDHPESDEDRERAARSTWRAFLCNLDPNDEKMGTSNLVYVTSQINIVESAEDTERREGVVDLQHMFASGKVRVSTTIEALRRVLDPPRVQNYTTAHEFQTRCRTMFFALMDADRTRLNDVSELARVPYLEDGYQTPLHLACRRARRPNGPHAPGTEWAIAPLLECVMGRMCVNIRDHGRRPYDLLLPSAAETFGPLLRG